MLKVASDTRVLPVRKGFKHDGSVWLRPDMATSDCDSVRLMR